MKIGKRITYNFTKVSVFFCLLVAMSFVVVYHILSVGQFENILFDVSFSIVVICVSMFFHQSQKEELKGFWLKPSYLFILGFLAVNLQFLIDFRLGLKTENTSQIAYPSVLNHCLVLAVVGLSAFVAGYSSVKFIKQKGKVVRLINKPRRPILLSIIQIVVFALFIYNIDLASFINGTIYGKIENNLSNYFENLLYVCNAVITVYAIKNNRINNVKEYLHSIPIVSWIVIVIYILLRLFSGDRGPIIYTFLLFLFGYLYATKKKIKLVYIASAGFAALVLVSVLGITRSLDKADSFFERLSLGYHYYKSEGRFGSDSQTVFGPTEELGGSFLVNQLDVNAVINEGVDLHYGTFFLVAVANGIPFMPSFIANVLHVRPENRSSSAFADYHFFNGYDGTYGLGTTCLGDFYLDFGVIGVLIGFLIAGMLFKYLDLSIVIGGNSIYAVLFILLLSAKSIYIPRSILLVDLQNFVLGVLLLWINSLLTRKDMN